MHDEPTLTTALPSIFGTPLSARFAEIDITTT